MLFFDETVGWVGAGGCSLLVRTNLQQFALSNHSPKVPNKSSQNPPPVRLESPGVRFSVPQTFCAVIFTLYALDRPALGCNIILT
jgi:hypothetical protein